MSSHSPACRRNREAKMTNITDIREMKARIIVFGVGGAGGNAVNNMIAAGLQGVDFIVANTDAQALTMSKAKAISSSTDVLVEARPLRRFFCIASARLFGSVRSYRRSFAILDAIDPTLVSLL